MRILMTLAAAVAAFTMTHVSPASANEAGVETMARKPSKKQVELAKDLPGTLILRVNNVTGQVEAAHVKERLGKQRLASLAVDESLFVPVDPSNMVEQNAAGEVDTRAIGWIFSFLNGLWNYPYYSYSNYDYYYSNYYSYPSSGWNYHYYNWPYYY